MIYYPPLFPPYVMRMQKLLSVVTAGFAAFLLAIGTPLLRAQNPADAIGDSVHLTGYTIGGVFTGDAMVHVPFTENFPDTPTVTVLFDINDNGKFKGGGEKVVDRVPSVAVAEFPTGYSFDLRAARMMKVFGRDPLFAKVIISDIPGGPIEKVVPVTKELFEIPEFYTGTPPGFTGFGSTDAWNVASDAVGPASIARADGLPAGANGVYNPGVPDLPGRKGKPNECFPIAAANSILWLAQQHNMTDKLPPTTNQLLDQLDQAVGYNPNVGTMDANMVSGKNAFAQATGLPLVNEKVEDVREQGASTLFPKIVQALKEKKDVELIMKKRSSATGKDQGGHAVTVVGAYTKGKKQYIVIHDPLTPNGNDTYEVGRNGEVKGYNGIGGKVYVDHLITEAISK